MKFTVYSKDNCVHCSRAVLKLTKLNLPFEQLKLGVDFTREELLAKFPQAKTFPQIEFDSGLEVLHIGTADDLEKWLDRPIESE
jgi:glutaredoxin